MLLLQMNCMIVRKSLNSIYSKPDFTENFGRNYIHCVTNTRMRVFFDSYSGIFYAVIYIYIKLPYKWHLCLSYRKDTRRKLRRAGRFTTVLPTFNLRLFSKGYVEFKLHFQLWLFFQYFFTLYLQEHSQLSVSY